MCTAIRVWVQLTLSFSSLLNNIYLYLLSLLFLFFALLCSFAFCSCSLSLSHYLFAPKLTFIHFLLTYTLSLLFPFFFLRLPVFYIACVSPYLKATFELYRTDIYILFDPYLTWSLFLFLYLLQPPLHPTTNHHQHHPDLSWNISFSLKLITTSYPRVASSKLNFYSCGLYFLFLSRFWPDHDDGFTCCFHFLFCSLWTLITSPSDPLDLTFVLDDDDDDVSTWSFCVAHPFDLDPQTKTTLVYDDYYLWPCCTIWSHCSSIDCATTTANFTTTATLHPRPLFSHNTFSISFILTTTTFQTFTDTRSMTRP